jgi:hypothetical protein
LDVANPSGKSEVASLLGNKAGHSEHKGMVEHHCHGCFSVALPQPVLPVAILESSTAPNWFLLAAVLGADPDTEGPPPKQLI